MIEFISIERIFSLSCFEGLRLLQKHKIQQPTLSIQDLISYVEKVEIDAPSFDLEASAHLSILVGHYQELDDQLFYQTCISAVLQQREPSWAKAMKSGRERFTKELSSDAKAVFSAAGLMVNRPSREIVSWWDSISGHARYVFGRESMRQAREAELLTIKEEIKRLKTIGINEEPKWPGLDDNFAGYDVLTYDLGDVGLVNRLIEVKSTIASPPRFIVSRNEWQVAKQSGSAYSFHIWDMRKSPPRLHVYSVADVELHIPVDQGNGWWKSAEIRLS